MRNPLKRSISILLAVILLIGIFTVLPAATAGAAADTSDPWIFAVNDGITYDLDGKWVRFGDEDFQLSGTGEFTLTNRTTYIYQLKYGTTHVADSRSTQAGPVHIGDTFYVTGLGTEDHPYIFTPNMIFYVDTVSTFGDGATVAMGYENFDALPNANNGVAVPGDGFKAISRMQVGANNYVRFLQHDGTNYQQTITGNAKGYIGVKDNKYGLCNNSSKTGYFNTAASWEFSSGNDTLYYFGGEDNGENRLYKFTETVNKRTSFSGTNKVICTVTWENQNGTKLKTMTYNLGETADDGGLAPTKAADAAYTYEFTGFEPAYEPLTDDMTYVATYEATPKGEMTYSVSAWIFPTNDGRVYDELEGMCYSYNGGAATGFIEGGSFSVVDNQILLCGVVVADIDVSQTSYKTFANTVYVTGDGTQADPFVFHPNYIYGFSGKKNVKDGPSIAVPGVSTLSGDKGTANPGDGFKAMSRIRVGTAQVQFLQQLGYYTASRNLLGVGETTYGYRYSKAKALPFSFVSDDCTLYYFEKTDSDIYQFSETKPPLRNTFRPSDSTIYTVTWKNYDNSVLDAETYYVGVNPTYKKGTPVKAKDADNYYTFNGWTPAVSAVTADAIYTATYTSHPRLFQGNSLTLDGDIGLNFYLAVTREQITTGSGTVVHFDRTVAGVVKHEEATLSTDQFITSGGNTYYKATCWVPAAEMSYNIHATATINGVLQDDTDDYSVRQYGLKFLADPAAYTPAGKSSSDLADLVNKMLDYGAKAQIVFNRATEVPLANDGIDYTMTEIGYDTITAQKSDMTLVSDYGLVYRGSSVIYLTQTTLRHYYNYTDSSKLDAVRAAAEARGYESTVSGSVVYFDKKNIAANDLDENYPISFDGEREYNYSVLDYSRLIIEKGTNPDERLLAMATYWYNDAANTYFG